MELRSGEGTPLGGWRARGVANLGRAGKSRPVSRQGPSENQVLLRRFCGDELFSVGEVSVWISHPGDGEEGGTLLNLEIHTRELLECSVVPEEERPLRDPRPTMEVWLPVPTLTPSELVGTSVHVKESYDASRDAMNRLYYCEHERMWGIDATFVEAAGDRCRVRLSGRSCDINHYSGDKPEAVVSADVWCTIPPQGYV